MLFAYSAALYNVCEACQPALLHLLSVADIVASPVLSCPIDPSIQLVDEPAPFGLQNGYDDFPATADVAVQLLYLWRPEIAITLTHLNHNLAIHSVIIQN